MSVGAPTKALGMTALPSPGAALVPDSLVPPLSPHIPLDRVSERPEYFDHLTATLRPSHPARFAGSLGGMRERIALLNRAVPAAQHAAREKLGAVACLGIMSGAIIADLATGTGVACILATLGLEAAGLALRHPQGIDKASTQVRRQIIQRQEEVKRIARLEGLLSTHGIDVGQVFGDITEPDNPSVIAALKKTLPDISHLPGWLRDHLIPIQAGEFLMGAKDMSSTKPVHRVLISAFYMLETEVTHAMLLKAQINISSGTGSDHPEWPVTHITHGMATLFARELTKKYGEGKVIFRLPTEAEWEYVASCGGTQKYGSGSGDLSEGDVNYKIRGHNSPISVYTAQKNRFGVRDLSGNVWEWCLDWFNLYPKGLQINPVGPVTGEKRILRGGSWQRSDIQALRAAFRVAEPPDTILDHVGFRLVAVPVDHPVVIK